MELGERLRQARLEKGLSQRQLCGEEITRNMLSQIENGSASPSVGTLRYLAARLGKPVGYFLEEQAVTSPNQQVMEQARQAAPEQALQLLKDYRAPDPVFDRERYLLEALSCLELGEQALDQKKTALALSCLEQAGTAGAQTPYYTRELERRRVLLLSRALPERATELSGLLEGETQTVLLLARAALQSQDPDRCLRLLELFPPDSPEGFFLMGEALFAGKRYADAIPRYQACPSDPRTYPRLEICFREQGDYRSAYHYACLQRQTE